MCCNVGTGSGRRPGHGRAADALAWTIGPVFASAHTLALRGLNGRTTPGHDRAKHGQRNGTQTKRHESGPRFAGQVPQRAADRRNDDRAGVTDREHAGCSARQMSAGKLKNGGRARIAVIETAPAIPRTAVAATMARDDVTKIIITRNAASIVGPKTRNGQARSGGDWR